MTPVIPDLSCGPPPQTSAAPPSLGSAGQKRNYKSRQRYAESASAEHEFELESPLNQNFGSQPGQPDQRLLLDAVTGLWNWSGMTRLLEESSHRRRMIGGRQTLVWLHISYRMPSGLIDEAHQRVQRELAGELLKILDFQDTIGHIADDQFLLILNQSDRATLITRLALLTDRVHTAFLKTDVGAMLEHIRLSAHCDVPADLGLADLLADVESNLPAFDQPPGTLFLNYQGVTESIQLIPESTR